MSSRNDSGSDRTFTPKRGRRFALRSALLAMVAVGALVLLQRGRTLEADAPPAATLVSPDGATLTIGKPYFVWDEEGTATEYRLRIDDSSTTVVDEWFDSGDVCASGTCTVTSPDSLANDSYTWWIQTKNGDGDGPLSSSKSFAVVAYGVVDGGFTHTVAADRDGAPSAWGVNTYGQVGDGSTLDRYTPVPLYGLTDLVDVQAGELHTVGLRNDGTVWSSGFDGNGQLGDGTTTDSEVPIQVSGITDATAIAVGRNHTLVLLSDGTVKAFGSNANGQLGDNTTTDRSSPVSVSGVSTAVAIGTGANHSLAVKSDGTVVAWGDNFDGQLGDGTQTERHTPVAVSSLTSVSLVAASSSANHSLALKSDGTVYAWGLNGDGQLGDNSATDRTTPVQASGLSGVVALAAGESHSLALKSDGTVRAWGDNSEGQLGDGTTTDRLTSVAVSGLSSIKAIGAGQLYSLAVEDDGTVYSWGSNENGQLGDGTTLSQISPLDISEPSFVFRTATPRIRVSSGTYDNDLDVVIELEVPTPGATIYYTTDGDDPTTMDGSLVSGGSVAVTDPLTLKAKAFATGYAESHLASETYDFQVAAPEVSPGTGTYPTVEFVTTETATEGAELRYTLDGNTPTGASDLYSARIPLLSTTTVKVRGFRSGWTDSDVTTAVLTIEPKAVGAGDNHSIALATDGLVYAWGNNSNGELGDRTFTSHKSPAAVSTITNIVEVAAGAYHSLALENDGTVWSWGDNLRGQLGDGTVTDRNSPVQVSSLTNAVAVAAGANHSLALEDDGTVWAWGFNTDGQLGDGTTTQRTSPVEVSDLTDVIAIGAGRTHSLAVKSDGSVWTWGDNGYLQLGDGSGTDQNTPIHVEGLTGIVAVTGGEGHSLALRDDGRVFAWGSGSLGRLGNGSTLDRPYPVPTLVSDGIAISAGRLHSVVVKVDGTIWGFGSNTNGQVGDGTTTSSILSPVQLSGPTDAVGVAGALLHSLGVTSDGIVWGWGMNVYGQVGDGTTVTRLAPVQVSDEDFDWKVSTPVFDLAPGAYVDVQSVTVTITTSGATIHYTTNGVEPTETDATVASGGTVSVDQNMTVKAKAFQSGLAPSNTTEAAYTIQVVAPQMSPAGGTYGTAQSVSLSTTTSGASIRYTTDGSDPTGSSALYSSALNIDTSTTLRAKAFKTNWVDSSTTTAVYTMSFGTLTAPVFTPTPPDTHESSVEVTIEGPGIATLRYTTDGSDPTGSSTIYTAPLTFTTTTTLKAKAFHPDYTASSTTTGVYTIQVPDPTVDLGGDTYDAGQTITISDSLSGAVIHYTIDGATPTENDPTIDSGSTITLLADLTLKVKAYKSGCDPSNVVTESYTVTGSITPPVIAAGKNFSRAIQSDDSGWAWGQNSNGQYGDGTTTQYEAPKAISTLTSIVDTDGGDFFALSLLSDGTAKASGQNSSGQLGDGTTTQRTTAVAVKGVGGTGTLSSLSAVATGASHSLALKSDGSEVYAWGYNANGRLGDGTTTNRTSPVTVTGLSSYTIVAIAAGMNHSIALTSAGDVYAWGLNTYGQLGDGTTTQRTSPVQVSTLSNIVAIAAGGEHNLALDSSGTVYGWGRNNFGGEIGDGTTTNRSTPVQVKTQAGAQSSGVTKVLAIGAGSYHSQLLRADGSLWGFGYNGYYQLGDGTNTSRSWPVPIYGVPGAVAATGGEYYTLAVTATGELFAWGYNQYGQVGDGSTATPQKTPVSISAGDLDWRVAIPVMSPLGGSYNVEKSVTLTTDTSGATIYYTTNGGDPTESDTQYTGAISITQTTTLKARAFKSGMADSVVAEELYTLTAAAPGFSPSTGTYSSNQNVTMSSTSQGVTIHYTTDLSTPTESSTTYTGTVAVTGTTVFRAAAFRTGWTSSTVSAATYTMKVATPSLSPSGGSFSSTQNVTVTGTTSGAGLHYTLDGTVPTVSSPTVVSGNTVTVDHSATLTVKGFHGPDWTASDSRVGTFYISQGTVAAPTADPPADTYDEPQLVSLTSTTPGALIRYTLDGTDPLWSSPLFTKPLLIDWSVTLKAKAFLSSWTQSSTTTAAYTINVTDTAEPVTFDPPEGRYATAQTVTLTTGTSGATIYYTTNGDDPTTSDSSVSSGGTVTVDRNLRLKAMTVKSGLTDSPVRRQDYLVTGVIAAAHQHALALKTDGTVLGWGTNTWGQLGRGTTTGAAQTPVVISSFGDVVAISANGDQYGASSFAVKNDGTLWAWGNGGSGRLGTGSTSNQTSPTQVSTGTGLTDAVAVAAGINHTLALDASGNVWAWGLRTSGALGDGSTSSYATSPQQVSGPSSIIAIAAGYQFSLALKSDGTVYAWGRNQEGQLGDGTTTQRTTPIQIPNLSGITAISAGGYHTLALQSEGNLSGNVWAFGYNYPGGQLGDGTTNQSSTPLLVAAKVLRISGSTTVSLLLQEDSGFLTKVLGAGTHLASYADSTAPSPTNRFIPILRDDFVDVSAGTSIQLALGSNTAIHEWGSLMATGADGEVLGDDTGVDDDPDGDGLTNGEEWALGTDPFDSDTNDDGILDGIAVASGMSATDPDMDHDGVLNGAERAQGTDPFNADTDGDEVNDGDDAFPLDPERDTAPSPDPYDTTPPTITLTEPTNATLISSIP
jgi:alpha-tubulin suppressor-like RCC1 family protein